MNRCDVREDEKWMDRASKEGKRVTVKEGINTRKGDMENEYRKS